MTLSLLKATTALSLCLSMAHPVPVTAQVRVPRGEAVAPTDGGLWRVQTCAEDPTQADCAPVDPTAPATGEAAPAPQPDEAVPDQTAPEAAAPVEEPAPAPEAPAADAPAPEQAPAADQPATEAPVPDATAAPEPAPVPEEVAPEPQPDAPTEPAVTPEPAAPEATAPETLAPEPAAPEAAAPDAPAAEPQAPDAAAPQPDAAESVAPAPEPAAPEAAGDTSTTPETAAPEDAPPATEPAPATQETEQSDVTEPAPEAAPVAPEAEVATDPAQPAPVDGNVTAEPLPEATPEQEQALQEMLADPEVAAAVETLSETVQPADPAAPGTAPDPSGLAAVEAMGGGAAPAPTQSTTQTLGAAEARSSTQDFATPVVTTQPTQARDDDDDDDGLSDLEKAGLLALGAVAVGMLINNNRVVANSGDRVVVDRGNGDLAIWKDDNANLRAPGVVETTDRYADGSTLTRLARPDGSQIVTVRDATGRVVRRDLLRADGSSVPIINDARSYEPVRVSQLPRPRVPQLRFAEDSDPALLRAVLEDAEDVDLGRTFSLAQVRDTRQLRELAPELTGDPITFATGSSAIRPEEARKLSRIAGLMRDLIADNPGEVFLVEGHTDAVGSAASNLALSDRRAESIALALSEIFAVPPENMIVQGYGERFLRVPTTGAEALNRRVALRRITWLMDGDT